MTQDLLTAYHAHGLTILDGLWPAAEIAELNAAADTLPTASIGAPAVQPHRWHDAFLRALRKPGLVGVMEAILGGPVSGLQSQYFWHRPGTRGYSAHQDNAFVQAPPEAFASAWVALDRTTADNGAIHAWPGTHREPILPTEPCPDHADQPGQNANANRVRAVVPPRYQGLIYQMAAGQTLIMHGHTVHGSGCNQSDGPRRAMLLTYLRRGAPFRPGLEARREEIDVY